MKSGVIILKNIIFKDRFFIFFLVCLSVFLITLFGCLFALLKIQDRNIANNKKYNDLYLLVDECRQTSDDLSTMVRLYVLTGDKKYEKFYKKILSIRKGVTPIPDDYYAGFWDFILENNEVFPDSGKIISFRRKILQEEMSGEKKTLLELSIKNSELLVLVEEEAINARQGKFKNATGTYFLEADPNVPLAIRLVSDSAYLKKKAAIMKPLQEFYKQIDREMENEILEIDKEHDLVVFVSAALLVCISFFMAFSLNKALRSSIKATESKENLLLSALPPAISDRLKHGEESTVKEYEACVLFLDVGMESQNSGQESEVLQSLYKEIDQLVETFKVERIRTLQGNYMVVSGISGELERYAEKLADFAVAVKDLIRKCGDANSLNIYIQAGMSIGTVISGLLDNKKYIYDLWGDVLKVANRLESNGVKGEIQITKKLESKLRGLFEMVEKEGDGKIFFLKKRIVTG